MVASALVGPLRAAFSARAAGVQRLSTLAAAWSPKSLASRLRLPLTSPCGGAGGGGLIGGGGAGGGGRRVLRMASSGGAGGQPRRSGLWATYLELLETQPMLSRCATCGLLNGLGDILSQLLIEQTSFDTKRFAIFTLLGLLFVGPVLTTWYAYLGTLVTAPGVTGTVLSVLVDQFFFAPIFITAFMSLMKCIEGKPDEIKAKLKQDLPDALKVNWLIWLPAQYVPPDLRVLAVNVVALAWNCYLSWAGNKSVDVPAPVAAAAAASPKGGKGKK